MQEVVTKLAALVALTGEGIAALVVAYSIASALALAAGTFQRPPRRVTATAIRLRLGRGMSVALELLLAADILRTAVAPTWNDIGQLAAIVVLRTALNFFLDREIRTETAL